MQEPTTEQIHQHLSQFTEIWKDGEEENPIPEGVKVTVYCDGGSFDTRGYVWNVTDRELGLEALVARAWILQSDLEKLLQS